MGHLERGRTSIHLGSMDPKRTAMERTMRWIAAAAVLGAVVAAAPVARAQEPGFHLNQAAAACAVARAATALGNAAEPRRADPGWVAFVVKDGRCTLLGAGTAVSVAGQSSGMAQIEYPRGSGQLLFIASAALASDSVPPPTETAPPSLWSSASAGSGAAAACGLSGPAGPGTLALTATADRPGVVRLILSKPSWQVTPRTPVRLNVAFAGMPPLSLAGTGGGASLEFALADSFKAWLHGFTAAASATLSFGGNEAPWQLDLAGTSTAISAMAECIRESGSILAPPPFAAPLPGAAFPVASAAAKPGAEPSRQAASAGGDLSLLDIELPPIRR